MHHCKAHPLCLEPVNQGQVRLKVLNVPEYRLGEMKYVHVSSDIFVTGEECGLICRDSHGT